MDNTGLIFIPDISGFTRFVTETELEHSRYIIEDLLEAIINSNELDLNISEIEGDAILFYKFGDPPGIQQLAQQVEKMFCRFHKQILNYEYRRMCQCLACKHAIDLSLKVIIHYGEFSSYKVKEFNKLLGKDIIIAHQLLKNDINLHEYMLVTDNLPGKKQSADLPSWVNWNAGKKITESGEVPYSYSLLTPLKEAVVPDPVPVPGEGNVVKLVSASREFDLDIVDLLAVVGNFSLRSQWEDGIRKVDQVSDKISRVGTTHRCVFDNNSIIVHYSFFSYHPEKIIFCESAQVAKGDRYYIFEKTGNEKTRLSLELYMKKSTFRNLMFDLFYKKKTTGSFERSLANLQKFLQTHNPVRSYQRT
jgi:hypothetical protein